VTFLLTDVEGSTKRWERDPELMTRLLERHDALLWDEVRRHGGTVVKSRGEGDSVFATFEGPEAAVAAALDIQRGLSEEPLRVRMAIHVGEVALREGDYFGSAVNRCARLRGVAHGGQVLLSRRAAESVRSKLPEGATLLDLGEHRLKDLSSAERVFQLAHPDLPADFPALGSLTSLAHNLPVQLTSFVGRESDIGAVLDSLGAHRLLTIAGPGGIGKTRLAIQAAAMLVDDLPGGAWLVELASVADPGLVMPTLAHTLGIYEQADRPLLETIVENLSDRKLLVVLDNCEHVLPAAAEAANALLKRCPDVRVLATSREPLGLAGESILRIQSLTLAESTELFSERVELGRQGASESGVAPAIQEICVRLDGVPLAIELAAARARTMPLSEVTRRLEDRFRLLIGGSRTTDLRHRTLRALLDWSHDLLSPAEQAVFRRLSVFAGGFTLAAAEATSSGADVEGGEVANLVSQLCDKSLLQLAPSGRYSMLETMREYGAERLAGAGESASAPRRHAEHFIAATRGAEDRVYEAGSEEVLRMLSDELDNVRAALAWMEGAGEYVMLASLVAAMTGYWYIRGHFHELGRWVKAVLAVDGPLHRDRAAVLSSWATRAFHLGDLAETERASRMALEAHRTLNDLRGVARDQNRIAMVAWRRGNIDGAEDLFKAALATAAEAGDEQTRAGINVNLGFLASEIDDLGRAVSHYEEAVRLFRSLGDRSGEAQALGNLGVALVQLGDRTSARQSLEQSLAIAHALGDRAQAAFATQSMGELELAEGAAFAAARHLSWALERAREYEINELTTQCLEGLARTAAALGRYEESLRFGGAAEASREAADDKGRPDDVKRLTAVIQDCRDSVGDERAAAALLAGRAMSPREVDRLAAELAGADQ
jgi:predicted ATPase/class 3 adenylate cyclase/Tfp pilus assembly protein PilF